MGAALKPVGWKDLHLRQLAAVHRGYGLAARLAAMRKSRRSPAWCEHQKSRSLRARTSERAARTEHFFFKSVYVNIHTKHPLCCLLGGGDAAPIQRLLRRDQPPAQLPSCGRSSAAEHGSSYPPLSLYLLLFLYIFSPLPACVTLKHTPDLNIRLLPLSF